MATNGTVRGHDEIQKFMRSEFDRLTGREPRLPIPKAPPPDPDASEDLDAELLAAAKARCRNGCGNSAFFGGCSRCLEMARFARDVLDELHRQRREAGL